MMQHKGSFSIVRKDNKILLVKMPDWAHFSDHWNFPGGLVDSGETLEQAAKREVLEETNIVCDIGALRHTVQNSEHNIEVSIFDASYVSGDIKIQEEEVLEAQWFTVQEALALPLAYQIRDIILELA
ncbi:MAG: mismatch repair protein MutT [Candidatus Saccharibacteria bacterium]|nr:mismatch repair protein MutT [Candidatus Saccharibacteria bacterium]